MSEQLLSLDELEGLSLEQLVALIPMPPTTTLENKRKTTLGRSDTPPPRKSSIPCLQSDSLINQSLIQSFCVGDIGKEQRIQLYQMLLKLESLQLGEVLGKAYQSFGEVSTPDSSPSADSPRKKSSSLLKGLKIGSRNTKGINVMVSKHTLDFGLKEPCPLKEEVTDEITVTIKNVKSKFVFLLPPESSSYSLEVTPDTGSFKKKTEVKFTFSLTVNSAIYLEEIVSLEIEGIGRVLFIIKLQTERSVFGEELSQYYSGGKVIIPPVLEQMKEFFIANNGLATPEIFRITSSEVDLLQIKDQINRDVFEGACDVHLIANLIKAWFRELPEPILQPLSENLLLSADSEGQALSIAEMLKEPNKTIFIWLIELLVDVSTRPLTSTMPSALSAVFAPNLYQQKSQGSEKAMLLPQKLASFVTHMINYRTRIRRD